MTHPFDRMRLAAPGERWVVRHRLADGSATDVTGWVVEVNEAAVVLSGPLDAIAPEPSGGPVSAVAFAAVLAARRVPAAPGGPDPRRTSADALERLALPAWAADVEPLGDWMLRSAGGFTGRANSCLAVGDPGIPVPEAASRIETYAHAHAIAPLAMVVRGSEPEQALSALGWTETHVGADVLVVRLAELLSEGVPDPHVELTSTWTPAWQAAFDLSRPDAVGRASLGPAVVSAVLEGRPPRAYGSVSVDGQVVAIGRGHLNGSWVGVASLWTRPDHRRAGLATAVLRALGHWAARRGARYAYLQVTDDNVAAHRAYARLGFVAHHAYRYLAPPSRGR